MEVKAKVERGKFLDLLVKMSLVALPRRNEVPFSGFVLLTLDGSNLTARVTNLEQYLIGNCCVKAEGKSEIGLPLKPLTEFIKAIKDDEIEFIIDRVADRGTFTVWTSRAFLELPGLPHGDFPEAPKIKGDRMNIAGLSGALKQVMYAVAGEETSRSAFLGVCFTLFENQVELVATDGFRLAATTLPASDISPCQFILPIWAAKLICRLKLESVEIRTDRRKEFKHFVSIAGDRFTLISDLIQGEYPDYRPLFPKAGGAVLKVKVGEFKEALRINACLPKEVIKNKYSRQKTDGWISLMSGDGKLVLSADNEGIKTRATIGAQGEIFPVKLNRKFLEDIINRLNGEIHIRTTGSLEYITVSHRRATHFLAPSLRPGF